MANVQAVRFSEFTLDRGRRELKRGERTIHLSPKAFHLLEMLIEAAPNAVPRDDLYRGLWPDTFVDEANLPNLVKEVRKALDEDSRSARLIKTLHGYGYAFTEVPVAESNRDRKWSTFVVQWSGHEFPLHQGENVVGRDDGADIRIDSAGVSRQHAAIVVEGDTATIRDLESKNGTYLGGERITAPAVHVGEAAEIRLGSATLRVRKIASGESTMTVSSHSDQS